MKFRSMCLAMVATASWVSASAASAADYLFKLTGDATASFVLDQTPLPSEDFGSEFRIASVAGTANGSGATFDVFFFDVSAGGALAIILGGPDDISLAGPQLFTGPTSAPSFQAGTYTLTNYYTGGGDYALTISEAAIPEPATWAVLLLGFGLSGAALRTARRRSAVV